MKYFSLLVLVLSLNSHAFRPLKSIKKLNPQKINLLEQTDKWLLINNYGQDLDIKHKKDVLRAGSTNEKYLFMQYITPVSKFPHSYEITAKITNFQDYNYRFGQKVKMTGYGIYFNGKARINQSNNSSNNNLKGDYTGNIFQYDTGANYAYLFRFVDRNKESSAINYVSSRANFPRLFEMWYGYENTLKIKVKGKRVKVFINGRLVNQMQLDYRLKGAGHIGLRVWGQANIEVTKFELKLNKGSIKNFKKLRR